MFYRISGLRLSLGEEEKSLVFMAAQELKVKESQILSLRLYRKSLDARKDKIFFQYSVDVYLKPGTKPHLTKNCQLIKQEYTYSIPTKSAKLPPVVVGFGPAGMFAALMLARSGLCPIVIERGTDVDARVRDVSLFQQKGLLNTESNIAFGEGGAGTFSDGKLNTLLKDKNYRGRFVLQELVKAGAPEEILYLNKPHIGTDRLRSAVKGIREEILSLGGQVLFRTRFLFPIIEEGRIKGLRIQSAKGEETIFTDTLFLAIGHSARDTFYALREAGVPMEKKIFSVGLRIEHLQKKIDRAQFGRACDSSALPPADYKLAVAVPSGKTLYTFCMCPGGEVVGATTEEGGVVVNGMSRFARDGKNANSALLLNVLPEELEEDLFSGFAYQRDLEKKAYLSGGGDFHAPCQLVGDFLLQKESRSFGEVMPTYQRGVRLASMDQILPPRFCQDLRVGIGKMGGILPGFDDYDAILTGVESRATCPVRILRGENFQSRILGLYPIGEGAGYAGGIMSSAMDGMKAVEAYWNELEERR